MQLPNPSTIERILLIRLRHIGDVLLTVPAIRSFREAFPKAFITALVNAGTEEMLTGNPLLDEVLVFDPQWKTLPFVQRIKQELRFLRQIRRRRFDLAVNFTEGERGAFLCLISGARYRVGSFSRKEKPGWKKFAFQQIVRVPDWRAHIVEQTLEIPQALGLPLGDRRVEIFYSKEDQKKLNHLLREEGAEDQSLLVHIHPTSRWLFKCWRDDGMAKIIDALQERAGVQVVLTSGSDDRELKKIHNILNFCRTQPINLAGKITLKQMAALSRRSLFFIGVDTAPMHIAAAMGTPVIALFGPSGEFNWGPWGEGHVVIKKDFDCRPCGQDGCQGSKKSRCLEEISDEEVLEHALQFLDRAQRSAICGSP
jgi:heptosyltransferase III